jgi:hypothetical protein
VDTEDGVAVVFFPRGRRSLPADRFAAPGPHVDAYMPKASSTHPHPCMQDLAQNLAQLVKGHWWVPAEDGRTWLLRDFAVARPPWLPLVVVSNALLKEVRASWCALSRLVRSWRPCISRRVLSFLLSKSARS